MSSYQMQRQNLQTSSNVIEGPWVKENMEQPERGQQDPDLELLKSAEEAETIPKRDREVIRETREELEQVMKDRDVEGTQKETQSNKSGGGFEVYTEYATCPVCRGKGRTGFFGLLGLGKCRVCKGMGSLPKKKTISKF